MKTLILFGALILIGSSILLTNGQDLKEEPSLDIAKPVESDLKKNENALGKRKYRKQKKEKPFDEALNLDKQQKKQQKDGVKRRSKNGLKKNHTHTEKKFSHQTRNGLRRHTKVPKNLDNPHEKQIKKRNVVEVFFNDDEDEEEKENTKRVQKKVKPLSLDIDIEDKQDENE